ncbi:uncharacterized protein [Lepeophtheirus salmonis]|uniref:uncharacterized protein isoform X2 n=1 Tax=Lepeophtheirus salmonis TaxID=72036 RepID=UPI001AE8290A|nr:espin-like isoform X2 [Lepeophtheirus salmonis]
MGLLKQVCLNNIEGIQNCLKTENANTKDSGGNTALHLAAEKGILPVAKLLVEGGADVNIRNESPGWTPLHFASYEGHLELVKFLVNEARAIPNIKDNQGDTPETWALEWENYKCAMVISEAIKKWKDKQTPPLDSPSSSEDEEDDDDDEEMSHWVLPLPTVIPKDLSKANIPQMKELTMQNNMDSNEDIDKKDKNHYSTPTNSNVASNTSADSSNSTNKNDKLSENSNSNHPNPKHHTQTTDSSKDTPLLTTTSKTLNENTSSNEKVNKKESDTEKLPEPPLDMIEPLLPSPPSPPLPPPPPPLPSTAQSEAPKQRRRKRVTEDSVKDDKPDQHCSKNKIKSNELEPICENGAIQKSSKKKSSSSPNVRRKNSSDSVPDIDKQLRYISKDKAFSRDLRGSAADIISMTSRFGDLARISRVKEDLLKKLDYLIEEERRQLENDLSKKFEELDRTKRRHREEEDRIEFEISLLSEKLENLVIPPAFTRAQCFSPPSIEKDITCVGCSRICIPPAKIFQCEEGDILCQECKENKGMSHCPECGIQILRGLSRNKALEKLARKHYD